ncbi:MAG: hypothetical protein Kow0047_06650 [Anaerolineae bacterium]
MRTIRTFILRVWVDPAMPASLHGLIQPLPEGEALPFADEQALLALLRRMLSAPKEPKHLGQEEDR